MLDAKKLLPALAALLALICLPALAEYWTAPGDLYFHAVRDCMGTDHPEVVGADDDALYPCPVCVQDETDYPGLEVFSLAGLTVVRMPDDWMAAQTEIEGIFAMTGEESFFGPEAEEEIARYLHGRAYAAFKDAVRRGKTAEATARYMANYDHSYDECDTVHLGGAWYGVYGNMAWPPAYDHDWTFRFFLGPMSQTGFALTEHICDEWDDYFVDGFTDPPLTALDDAPTWSQAGENYALDLYETHGFRLAVLRLTGRDALLLPRVLLTAPGWPEPIEVSAAKDGEDALYGFLLSEGQAAAMKAGGATPSWQSFETFDLNYGGTPYAVTRTEQENDDYLVLNEAGDVVLRSSGRIDRVGNVFLSREAEPREAYEAIGFVGEDGYYQQRFQRALVYDADSETTLLRGDYLFHDFDMKIGGVEYETWLDVEVAIEGANSPVAVLKNDDGSSRLSYFTSAPNPATRFTVSGSAAVYTGSLTDDFPVVPEGCFVALFRSWSALTDDPPWPCVVVAWSLDGSEPPIPEALGLVDESGKPLVDRAN